MVELVANRATWEAELGEILLESGETKLAADSMVRALTLFPKLNTRPLVAFYLSRMGREIPDPPRDKDAEPAPVVPKKAPEPGAEAGKLPEDVFATPKP